MALSWTDVSEKEIINSSSIKELVDNINKTAQYLDTVQGNNEIYNALETNGKDFSSKKRIYYRDSLYNSIDLLDSKSMCVSAKSSYKVADNDSCYSYTVSANTSVQTSKYVTHNSTKSIYSCTTNYRSHYGAKYIYGY